ncbi:MAG TPA: pantetheine-phosphate adenylyltransferase [archaeon]|nr:pantetheine-phosphate adenylyltransferase [archaeon]
MKRAVYAGTFDPVTLGHLDIIERSSKIFDELIVAVAENKEKFPLFSLNERIEMIEKSVKSRKVKVEGFSDLLVDFAERKNAKIIIKGLRAMSDFEYEFQQSSINRNLNKEIESFYVMTNEKFFYLSSSIVKEIASLKGNVSMFVPSIAEKKLKEKFR